MAETMTRMSRSRRRTQLLDVAAELVLTAGVGAVTMERLAERAGVSKALVYLHFDNAAAVLAELYHREVTTLGEQVAIAVEGPDTPEVKLRAAVSTYFDVVTHRGALFTVLAPGGSTDLTQSDGSRIGQRFVTDLFQEIFGLPNRRARTAATVFLGALNGGVEAWALGELTRAEVEEAVVSVALHLASNR